MHESIRILLVDEGPMVCRGMRDFLLAKLGLASRTRVALLAAEYHGAGR